MTQPNSTAQKRPAGETTPAGRNLSEWFRQLDRYVRMVRTFGPAAPNAVSGRERTLEDFMGILQYHAPIVLHCTPLEIWLRDEAVVRPPGSLESEGHIERRIPFLLYRDGIRSLTFTAETTRDDVAALLDGLARVTTSHMTNEDLVTLLWEADLHGLRVDVAPVEQILRVRAFGEGGPGVTVPEDVTGAVDWQATPEGERHVYGESAAAVHRHAGVEPGTADTDFDDWPLPTGPADPLAAWRALAPGEEQARAELRTAWEREHQRPWIASAPELVAEVMRVDAGPNTVNALSHALVTWLGSAFQRCEWTEAAQAMVALESLDPSGEAAAPALASVLQAMDAEAVAERLDESEPDAQAQFFALTVRIGRPALDLVVGVLATATRVRLRAAATTALAYLCADDPRTLGRFLSDSRWYLVRNIVFVLGQIGGPEIVPLLAATTRHADIRVRRSVVHALGQAPAEDRLPLLVALLESPDAQTVAASLAMLTRDSDPRITSALLERVTALDFEKRPDDVKYALIAALGDAADENVVPALEQVLQKGGWFARRTAERTAAAQTLARIGSPAAMAVLQLGLHSRADAIRSSCQDALARVRGRAA